MNQKGISSIVIILIILGILVIAGGAYYFIIKNPPSIFQTLLPQIFVCSNDGKYKIIDKDWSVTPGGIFVLVKQGVSRETFVNKLKELNLYNEYNKESLSEYSPTPRSVLMIKSKSDDYFNQIKESFKNVQGDDFDEIASYSNNIFGEHIFWFYFKRILSDTEKESIISSIPSQYKYIIVGSWHSNDTRNGVVLSVPTGTEKQTIEKLKKSEIFKCVSRATHLRVPTRMPSL